MSTVSRQLVRVFLVVAVLGALILVLKTGMATDPPTHVSVIRPVRHDFSSFITTNGKVEPIEPGPVQARLTTFIEKLLVKEGDSVRRGQVLMTLDGSEFQSQLASLREQLMAAENDRAIGLSGGTPAELAQLENDLAKTEAEIQRLRVQNDSLARLYARQAATRDELEQNKAALERAETDKRLIERKKAAISQSSKLQAERASLRAQEAQASIRSVQDKVNSARVTAPVNGTIYSLPARPGTLVHAGDTVAEIADLTHIRARVFVDEPELGSLQNGQAVEVTWDALPNRVWQGQVTQLPKTIVARGSRNVGEVLCSVENEGTELLPETNVNVRIRTAKHSDALTIPRSAVLTEGNKKFVWIIDSNRLRKQPVTVGISNMQEYEIVNGLSENDLIALPVNAELHEGQVVTTDAP